MRTLLAYALLFTAGPALAAPAPKGGSAGEAADVAERLMDRHDFDRVQEIPLRTVLDALQEKTGVSIVLDYRALADNGAVANNDLDTLAVSLNPMKNVRGETAVRQVADKINAVLFYTPDHVLLTTPEAMARRVNFGSPLSLIHGGPPEETDGAPRVEATAFVTAAFRDMPLADVLRAVSNRTNRTAVVAADAAEKAKAPVSASLANVPFETAVSTLAEAAGLKAIRNGNTVLVVTQARAKELTEAERRLSVGMGNYVLSLEELQAIAKLIPGKPDADAIQKEVKRLRAEKGK
ncbi:MAG TPA: hypothetical protein VM597_39200 [Gemmataceae bacterium]|jgi:hypothetical protein|nr:hypothetical protein [Gemmataceae bacterium]